MSSDLDAAQLARLAHALNPRCSLPSLVLLTDDDRLPDAEAAAERLPRGSAVILRSRNPVTRARLARRLRPVVHRRELALLVSEDAKLARDTGADGLHLPERRAREAAHWKALRPDWIVTAAAHSLNAVMVAARAGADAVLLAPVFSTRSHPGGDNIGAMRAANIVRLVHVPVYALGGIDVCNARRLTGCPLAGFAGIEALKVVR